MQALCVLGCLLGLQGEIEETKTKKEGLWNARGKMISLGGFERYLRDQQKPSLASRRILLLLVL